ncbi:MAG TPA: hypothetical protein VGB97_03305 [Candidatus Paceibacterota bacterium]|jgi:hypothetical protein
MPPQHDDQPVGEYITHFFKFLATFVLIIGVSLFLFTFTAGA